MEPPYPNSTWETCIPIQTDFQGDKHSKYLDILRFQVKPMIKELERRNLVNWYCFLVHNNKSAGFPPDPSGKDGIFIHIRLSFKTDLKEEEIENILPEYCEIPIDNYEKPMKQTDVVSKQNISGMNSDLLKGNDTNLAWKVLGEVSEWALNMLNIYKDDITIPPEQILLFIDFPLNKLNLKHKFLIAGRFYEISIDNYDKPMKQTDVVSKQNISGIDSDMLKGNDTNLAWKVLDEASQWVLNMLDIYKDDITIPTLQLLQFIHFLLNMLHLNHKFRPVNGDYEIFIFV